MVMPKVISTTDQSEWVAYTHGWPFDGNDMIRPYDEFIDGRFKEISDEEVRELLAKDREEFKREILEAKAMARDK